MKVRIIVSKGRPVSPSTTSNHGINNRSCSKENLLAEDPNALCMRCSTKESRIEPFSSREERTLGEKIFFVSLILRAFDHRSQVRQVGSQAPPGHKKHTKDCLASSWRLSVESSQEDEARMSPDT